MKQNLSFNDTVSIFFQNVSVAFHCVSIQSFFAKYLLVETHYYGHSGLGKSDLNGAVAVLLAANIQLFALVIERA